MAATSSRRRRASTALDDAPVAPFPDHVRPMLAKLDSLPPDAERERWAFEVKWDGIRALVFVRDGTLRIETRNLNDVTAQYPELAPLADALAGHDVVLDGEIVAFDAAGRPSFQRLQERLGLSNAATIRTRAVATPVRLHAFDLLHLDGRDLRGLPYLERRAQLERLGLEGRHWQVPRHHVGEGRELLDAVLEQGLEGIVAKRVDSPYRENARGGDWRKVKVQRRQEFVVGGWSEGAGRRAGGIGALLLGYHDVTADEAATRGEPQPLVYAGSVGTGFGDRLLADLAKQLAADERDTSPFDVGSPGTAKPAGKWQAIRARERERADGRAPGRVGATRVHYVEPRLVCDVEFTEFTRDGTLRHPSFKGLRTDKAPADVVREDLREGGP